MVNKTDNPTIKIDNVEESEKQQALENPQSQERRDIANRVWDNYTRRQMNRDRLLDYFRFDDQDNARNCVDYWNDSEKRANSFSLKPDWKEEYQENVFNGVTNAKLMVYVAQYINQESRLQFKPLVGANKIFHWFAKFFGEIYNYIFGVIINEKMEKLKRALSCLTFGTVIVRTDYNKKRDKFTRPIVDLRNYYFENIYNNTIQQPATERLVLEWREFYKRFKDWEDADLVPKYEETTSMSKDNPFNVSEHLQGDKVELIIDYDTDNKLYHITANGVLITPTHSPFPKRWLDEDGNAVMPFAMAKFELFATNFVYGRSLPDKLQNMQDIDNKLWNMTLDQMKLTINPPLLVGMGNDDIVAGNYHYPGAVWQLDQPDKAKWLDGGEPGMAVFRALEKIEGSMDRMSNIDPNQQGISVGQRTATETKIAARSADVISGLFNFMMDDLEQQLAEVSIPHIKRALGSKTLKEFVTENVRLIGKPFKGELGTRVLRIENNVNPALPLGHSEQLAQESGLIDKKAEIFTIAKNWIDKFRMRIEILPDITSQEMKRVKKTQFATLILGSVQDERREKAIGVMAEEAGLDPTEWIKEMTPEQKEMAGMSPEMQNAMQQQSPGNTIPTLKSMINQQAAAT